MTPSESSLTQDIKSRGHWASVVRPVEFQARRLPYESLVEIMEKSQVELRGWKFPSFRMNVSRHGDHIASEEDWTHFRNVWRLYETGQFAQVLGFPVDWLDRSGMIHPVRPKDWAPGKFFGIGEGVRYLTELFEFAWRLCQQLPGTDGIVIETHAMRLSGRKLFVDTPRRLQNWFPEETRANSWTHEVMLSREELGARTRDLAVEAADKLFQRFGRRSDVRHWREWQTEVA